MLSWIRRRGLLPKISETERQALNAGTVWIDRDLFAGRLDWRRIEATNYPRLTDRERAFLDGPVGDVCSLVDPNQIEGGQDLPPAAWEMIREHRFFGLLVPEAWGGHGFSALATSTIVGVLATRSAALSAIVLIPNSVGPAELLLDHGTDEQRARLLPRLADGRDIPCFALTEPRAGSDAAALRSRGVVVPGPGGEPRVRLSFDKRYITLAPIATLIGLAFRLEDPDEILGRGRDLGITVALVPADTPGVEIGSRHDPLGVPFPNGPIRGRDVEVGLEAIVGEGDGIGRGWPMLMEALSAGRAISLPAQSAAAARYLTRVVSAYSGVRRQFGVPIQRFEGIEERLARLAGLTYLMEAARVWTCGAVDDGHRPAVVSAVMKAGTTELARELAEDAMDVLGGAAICLGPRNLVARAWIGAPIAITVEGANILTRTLITFGQGIVRSHPRLRSLMDAAERDDTAGIVRAAAGYLLHLPLGMTRAALLGLTRGWLGRTTLGGPLAGEQRRLAWAAARFGLWADLTLLTSGPRLKTRGRVAGRFADMLTWIYLGIATVRRFEAEGRPPDELPAARWAVAHALDHVQRAFEGILTNLGGPLGLLTRGPVAWWARLNRMGSPPSDRLGSAAAGTVASPGDLRDRLTPFVHLPTSSEAALAVLERAFVLGSQAEPLRARLRSARRRGEISGTEADQIDLALTAGLIDGDGAALLRSARDAESAAIQVDEIEAGPPLGDARTEALASGRTAED